MNIKLEYCAAWGYEEDAVSLTETVLLEYKQDVDEFTLVPSDGGVFEVYKNGEKIYSKDETGEFPDEGAIVRQLGNWMTVPDQALDCLTERLDTNSSITILTGAGISAASGIPTFRGDDGLWEEFDPSDLASPQGFRRDPETVWKWYDERRKMIADAEPNAGHKTLAEWENYFDKLSLITQNVDGLHEEAGSESVIKLHGSIWEVSCWDDCDQSPTSWTDRSVPVEKIPPTCSDCGGLIRPEVVWFGEQLDPDVLDASEQALNCDVFFTIGTSAEVHPAAGFISRADRQGAFTVEINPDTTSASQTVDLAVQQPAEEFLPQLNEVLKV